MNHLYSFLRSAAAACALILGSSALFAGEIHPDFTTVPDNQEIQTELSGDIVITFPDLAAVNFAPYATTVTDARGTFVYAYIYTDDFSYYNEDVKVYANGTNSITCALDETITADGVYTLQIEYDKLVDQAGNDIECTVEFVIGDGGSSDIPVAHFSPAPGFVSKIEAIEMTVPGSAISILNPGMIFLSKGSYDYDIVATVPSFGTGGLVITLADESTITEPGDYTLIVGMGAIAIDGASNAEPYVANYTIPEGGSGEFGIIVWDPADGSDLEQIKEFYISFIDATTVAVNPSAAPAQYPAVYELNDDNSRGTREQLSGIVATWKAGNVINIWKNGAAITAPGKYEVVIPAGFISVDGVDVNEPISAFYTIGGGTEQPSFEYTYIVTPDPAEVQSTLNVITVAFSGVSKIEIDQEAWFHKTDPKLALIDAQGNVLDTFPVTYPVGADNKSLLITVNQYTPVEVSGTYRLTIPAKFLTLTAEDGTDTRTNDEIVVLFTIDCGESGIVDITSAGVSGDVYTIGGVKVGGNNLPAGIYIVGGKKIFIK